MFLHLSPAYESLKNDLARWQVEQVASNAIKELGILNDNNSSNATAEV